MRRFPGVLVMVGALMLATPSRGAGQISPGALSRPHRALEGATSCLKCHPVGSRTAMDGACLECHKEIAWLKAEKRGLHAREARNPCSSCHPEHAGEDFSLVPWTRDSLARFDHRRTGWELVGAHAQAKCDACHKQAFRVGNAAKLAPLGSKATWWIGLETSCASCHEEVHRRNPKITGACTDCHDTKAWAPATKFDHAKTDYPLIGKHADVVCEKCHVAKTGTVAPGKSKVDPAFVPPRSAECSGCHKDPHQGRLGATCSDCHVTTGFLERKAGGFDHGRTRYPLEGRHVSVQCAKCHRSEGQRVNPPFATCSSCHKDAHAKSATVASKVSDCVACHTVSGFKPSSFTVEKHGQARCRDCHVESHGDQLVKLAGAGSCESCHRVTAWQSTAFVTSRHAEFRFPLEGRHAAVACGACHGEKRQGLPPLTVTQALGTAKVLFRLGSAECISCHVDPHQRRYATCTDCHTASSFHPATIDLAAHARLGFALEGAHRAQPCAACHEGMDRLGAGAALVQAATRPATLSFTTGKKTCAACHTDPHGGQFASRKANGCEACHGEDQFKPAARFNHDRDGSFKLEGAHAKVACGRCHPTETDAAGKSRMRFRPVSPKCESCHPAKVPASPRPGA